jgi:hypothetical protein
MKNPETLSRPLNPWPRIAFWLQTENQKSQGEMPAEYGRSSSRVTWNSSAFLAVFW